MYGFIIGLDNNLSFESRAGDYWTIYSVPFGIATRQLYIEYHVHVWLDVIQMILTSNYATGNNSSGEVN